MGVWAAVVSGILFIGFYSWRTAEEARRMAKALAAAEMVLAREQKLSALDGLAAAAAHGLGTPLATIAVVTKELMRGARPDGSALRRSRAAQGAGRALPRHPRRDRRRRRAARPDRVAAILESPDRGGGGAAPPDGRADRGSDRAGEDGASRGAAASEPVTERNPGVLYGLGNLVENAVDFAASKVDVEARWSNDEVRIVIADDGTGFPPNVLEQLGEPFVTTRRAPKRWADAADEHVGMGLGFFIAKTLLERSGARLELANRRAGRRRGGDGGVAAGKFEQAPEKASARAEPAALAKRPSRALDGAS